MEKAIWKYELDITDNQNIKDRKWHRPPLR